MVFFTIIIPHYQGSTSKEELMQCITSIMEQECQDYELLLFHDGPLIRDCPYEIIKTSLHYGDWGHSLRDLGIRMAKGEWIVMLNSDSILYPKTLKKVKKAIKEHKDYEGVIIMPVFMNGLQIFKSKACYSNPRNKDIIQYFKGEPEYARIDCMQLVMKKEDWLRYGGWYDKRCDGDGHMYPRFMKEKSFIRIGDVCGEHN